MQEESKMGCDIINNAEGKMMLLVSPKQLKEAFQKWYEELNSCSIPKKDDEDTLMTAGDVCKMLSISNPTLWRWNRDGILTKKKIGGHIYYRKKDVIALTNNNK